MYPDRVEWRSVGLCTEFGPRIQLECDHPMMAGVNSCSCPSCHSVCTGNFAGCPAVWARGPTPITVRSRSDMPDRNRNAGARAEGSNGQSPPNTDTALLLPSFKSDNTDVILADLRVLAQQLSEYNMSSSGGHERDLERVAERLLQRLDALPDRLAAAISKALTKQHQLIIADVNRSLRLLAAQLDSSDRPPTED